MIFSILFRIIFNRWLDILFGEAEDMHYLRTRGPRICACGDAECRKHLPVKQHQTW